MLTCAKLAAAILSAAPGATLTLAPGQDCAAIVIANRVWDKPVTINAKGATVRGLTLEGVDGLNWQGGTLRASGGRNGAAAAGYAMRIRKSANIAIRDAMFTDAARGLVAGFSDRLLITNNQFQGLRSDGINLAATTQVQVLDNRFRDFTPNKRRCTHADGRVQHGTPRRDCAEAAGEWKDGDHPDAIQMWGDTDDVLIRGNDIAGSMQAIGFFGRRHDKRSRIRIEDNIAASSTGWGISLQDCADCTVTGNRLSRFAGGAMKQRIVVTGSTGRFCGNSNPDAPPESPTTAPCPG